MSLQKEQENILQERKAELKNQMKIIIKLLKEKQLNAAKDKLQKILKIDSQNLIAMILLSVILKLQNNLEESYEILDEAQSIHHNLFKKIQDWSEEQLMIDTDNSIANYLWAYAIINQKNKDQEYFKALEMLDKAIRIDESFVLPYISKTCILGRLSEYELELQCCQECIEKFPNNALARFIFGSSLLNHNYLKEALNQFEEAIKLCSNFKQLYVLKGQTLFKLDQQKEALQIFQETLMMKPQKIKCYQQICDFLKEMDHYKEAYDFAVQYLALFPNDINILKSNSRFVSLFQVAHLVDNKEMEKAVKLNQHALELFPYDLHLIIMQVDALFELHQYEETIMFCNQYLNLIDKVDHVDRETIDICFKKGLSLFQVKNFQDALNEFEIIIHVDDSQIRAFQQIPKCLFKLKRYNEAIECGEICLKDDQGNPEIITLIGDCFFQRALQMNKGQKTEIYKLLDQAFSLGNLALIFNENYSQAYRLMGQVLKRKGKRRKAIKMLQKSMLLDPLDYQPYIILSKTLPDQRLALFHLRIAKVLGEGNQINYMNYLKLNL